MFTITIDRKWQKLQSKDPSENGIKTPVGNFLIRVRFAFTCTRCFRFTYVYFYSLSYKKRHKYTENIACK